MAETAHEPALTDVMIDPETLPWVPQADGVWFRPLRLSPATGTWTNLLKVSAAGTINRHRHLGAVEAWVLRGSWRYLEHDWVAGPGAYVYEAPGEVHTLQVQPGEEMITLFQISGPIEYLDDDERIVRVDSAESKLRLYEEHCAAHGLERQPLVF